MAAHTPEGQLQTLTSEHTDTLFRPERSARNVRGRGSAGGGRGKGEPYATHAALAAHAPLCHQDPPLNKQKDVAPPVADIADCSEGKKTIGMSCVREQEIQSDTEMGGCVGEVSWEERLRPGPNAPLIDLLRYSLAHTQVK